MDIRNHDQNYLEISREILASNAKAVTGYVGVPVIGVVKCNGYGVSIPEAALAWQKAGVTMFAVSTPQEALCLRQAGFREDILLLAPVADQDTLASLLENNIILTVSSFDNARFYSLHTDTVPLRVHVAIDTGMGRFGIRWTDTEQLTSIYNLAGFRFEGIFSHFAKSFEKQFRLTKLQLDRFLQVTQFLTNAGFPVGTRHIANSCAALRFPETWLDAVRCGSALVGSLLAEVPVSLKYPAIFKAQVVATKVLLPGDTTGYGSIYKVKEKTNAIVVAIGCDNGFGTMGFPDHLRFQDLAAYLYHMMQTYRRRLGVTWNGNRLPMIGRMGNQYTMFDAGNLDIHPGDYVSAQVSLLFPYQNRKFK